MSWGVYREYTHTPGVFNARIRKEIYRTYCAIPEDILTLETGEFLINGQVLGFYPFDPLNGLYIQLVYVDDRPHQVWYEEEKVVWVDDAPDKVYT